MQLSLKYVHATNRSSETLFFLLCTISRCVCQICAEWTDFETRPVSGSPGWIYGILTIGGYSDTIECFCPQWNCIGACYFSAIPPVVTQASFFGFDESSYYEITDGKTAVHFSSYYPGPQNQNQRTAKARPSGQFEAGGGVAAAGAAAMGFAGATGVIDGIGFARNAYSAGEAIGDIVDVVTDCVIS